MYNDTITAISTALGEGAIGLVRLSGPHAYEILQGIFFTVKGKTRKSFESHRLYYGYIADPAIPAEPLDEVMAVYLASPRTYTREPMAEISCHGGSVPLEKILNLTLRMGARHAEPGEFTLRAFLNGRLDLAQAEAVQDIVRSKTGPALEQALGQLAGKLSQRIAAARQKLLSALAQLEAMIDFPEDDVPFASVSPQLRETLAELELLLATADAGQIYRQGIRAAIVGVPNVGKSSLLNALLRNDRAIVTPVAGTTRDLIEETLNVRGVPVVLVDTAGITATEDMVERIGIERSRQAIASADLLMLALDSSRPLHSGDLELIAAVKAELLSRPTTKAMLVLNKIDINNDENGIEAELQQLLPDLPCVRISAQTGDKLNELEEALAKLALGGKNLAGSSLMITNTRHRHALERAREHLLSAILSDEASMAADFISIDLRLAMEAMGEITGESVQDSLLHEIFSTFCIGK
ncbi:tRNA uridine-5-carboxymethylaminomethyl(34) synthesis GTPase MnmE [Candidatus Chlorohelix sp.]|uniref:tRNA uridine-5-carboxymethylaminomethyl(34) synthesis GTPase MnmE n=1 Tax=Candidatus Chlorohelix sp. TaxID=3139201 RepID=UPI00304793A9